jgi:ketosteroid isomerase-like protein
MTRRNTVPEQERRVIERYFRAMRTGAAGGEEMMNLFAEDAVYVDPFGDTPQTHTGKGAIRRAYLKSRQDAPPDMTLTLDRVDFEGERIRTEWTCCSPAFPHPMRGQDLWTIRGGRIIRLETILLGAG